jgi:hypothetical protein
MAKPTVEQVTQSLNRAITKEGVSWGDIVKEISEELTIKNWMTQVRGPLQTLVNSGNVMRVASVHYEIYKKTK